MDSTPTGDKQLLMRSMSATMLKQQQQQQHDSDHLPSSDQSDGKATDPASDAKSNESAVDVCQQTRKSNGLSRFMLKKKTRSDCKKLPVLTCVELVECASQTSDQVDKAQEAAERVNGGEARTSTSKKILFKDYVLISAKTKFKYLIHSIFKNTSLSSKDTYKVLDGSLKLKNWVRTLFD